jgi:hypothetical protein
MFSGFKDLLKFQNEMFMRANEQVARVFKTTGIFPDQAESAVNWLGHKRDRIEGWYALDSFWREMSSLISKGLPVETGSQSRSQEILDEFREEMRSIYLRFLPASDIPQYDFWSSLESQVDEFMTDNVHPMIYKSDSVHKKLRKVIADFYKTYQSLPAERHPNDPDMFAALMDDFEEKVEKILQGN